MAHQTTLGWSLFTSGLVTLFLKVLPYDSLYWGILLLFLGVVALVMRQT
jgi:hypothetical protein